MPRAKKEETKETKAPKQAKKVVGRDTFTKAELGAMSKDVFKNVKVSVLYATEDGSFFFKESDARLNASNKKLKEVIEFNK